MAAIVTNKFRIANAGNFKEDLADANTSVYVYIAKSDAWSNDLFDTTDSEAPNPLDQDFDEAEVHANMIAMKLLSGTDVSHVIPRYNWTYGNVYTPFDDADPDLYDKQFYVITDEFKIYKCIEVGRADDGTPLPSVERPIHTGAGIPQQEGDGYLWKYITTLQVGDSDKFLTNFYTPIKTVRIPLGGVIGDLSPDDQTQYNVQQSGKTATEGSIFRIAVENGGTGYTTEPIVTIVGDGINAIVTEATITLDGGAITKIALSNVGTGYSKANVEITGGGGTGAVARAIITPGEGHGSDPVKELGGFYIATNVKLEYADGGGDFIVDNAFRQVGLIKNPWTFGTSTVSTDPTLSGLKSMTVSGLSGAVAGESIRGFDSKAYAFIDSVDTGTGVIKYHQNEKTGYIDFQQGEAIEGAGAYSASGTITALGNEEYSRGSGDIMFIENRDPINRSSTQIEDIKIIIEF